MAWRNNTNVKIVKRYQAGRELEYAVYNDEFIEVWGSVTRNRNGYTDFSIERNLATDGSARVIRERRKYEVHEEWPGLTKQMANILVNRLAKVDVYMSAEAHHLTGGGYTVHAVRREYEQWGNWFPEYLLNDGVIRGSLLI